MILLITKQKQNLRIAHQTHLVRLPKEMVKEQEPLSRIEKLIQKINEDKRYTPLNQKDFRNMSKQEILKFCKK